MRRILDLLPIRIFHFPFFQAFDNFKLLISSLVLPLEGIAPEALTAFILHAQGYTKP